MIVKIKDGIIIKNFVFAKNNIKVKKLTIKRNDIIKILIKLN